MQMRDVSSSAAPVRARLRSVVLGLAVLIALAALIRSARAENPVLANGPTWKLEIVSDYTCVGTTGVSYNHTDHHEGSVSFAMPEVSSPVEAGLGDYSYRSSGQTMGHPWEIDAKGTLTFKGEVTPGLMRFTAEVYLADGRPLFDSDYVVEIPVFDGATAVVPVMSVPEVTCTGQAVWTLRGQPLEKYLIRIDDRLLWAKDHGVFSGYTYRTGATIQLLTEIELVVEGKKIRSATGTRRLGRVTPSGNPPRVWTVTTPTRTCPDDGLTYPHAPPLSAGGVSASVRDEATIAVSVSGGTARLAVQWVIDPKAAKAISPDIQHGRPERFNDYWCAKMPLPITRWSFTRRRNSVTVTEDSFDHLQVFTVTQEATVSSASSGTTAGAAPASRFFKGDTGP